MLPSRVISQPFDYSYNKNVGTLSIPNIAITKVTNLTPNSQDGIAYNPAAQNIPLNDKALFCFSLFGIFAANAVGQRRIYLYKNTVALAGQVDPANNTAGSQHYLSGLFFDIPNAGDVYDLRVFQSSGAALILNSCFFTIIKVRDL
jgi:hypothetical protein